MNAAARQLIAALALEPLPGEGGYFRQTWRSASASAIFFLLTRDDFSAFHRIAQDEMWHFHAGDGIEHVQLDPSGGAAHVTRMGPDVLAGQQPQLHVPAGVWQGARIEVGRASARSPKTQSRKRRAEAPPYSRGFALLGCTVSPPWDEQGFELARRDDLLREFPAHDALIRALTR